jgi:putative transposase
VGHKHRIEIPGGLFHVTGRGNAQATIFVDDVDYMEFVRMLGAVVSQYGWLTHSYSLLPNHYHLLVETPDANLGAGMHRLNGRYARRFNQRYRRFGHVFQGPYGAELVERDEHLQEVYRYVVLNPVRAGLCEHFEDWPWTFVDAAIIRELFGSLDRFRAFVADGVQRPQPGLNQVAASG